MDEQNLEEEVDTLEYVLDNLSAMVYHLKNISSKEYVYVISQMQEVLNDLDYILIEKEEALDNYNEQQLIESRLERYERELEYRKNQGF